MSRWRNINAKIFPPRKDENLLELERKIGYRFKNPTLAEKAVTHRSIIKQQNLEPKDAYERLEFLGDAVLGLIVSRFLIRIHPESGEGELTKLKSLIVSGEVLSQRAEELGLGKHLLLGNSEIKTGGRKRPSILEDIFESLVGAIYLDGGLKKAEIFVHRHLLNCMDEILHDDEHKNYKSVLLEHAQAEMSLQPVYRVVAEEGPDHRKVYQIKVSLNNHELGQGVGSSKKRAEQRAAKAALKKLDIDVD